MSRLVPFALAGVGAAVTSVGGVYLIKGTSAAPQADKIPPDLGFTNHETFKSSHGGPCAKRYFGEVNYDTKGSTELSSAAKADGNYFPGTGGNEGVKSCLVINWDRTDSTNAGGKWKGSFKWLWTLVKGSKGFVTFAHYKPSATENKMKLESWIYFLEKDEGKQTWSVKKHKEFKDSGETELDTTKFGETFPGKGEAVTYDFTSFGAEKKDQWGFTKSDGDLNKICKSGDNGNCPTDNIKETSFRGSWSWKPDTNGGTTIDKWGKDSISKLSKIYESCLELNGSLVSIKGTWNLEDAIKTP